MLRIEDRDTEKARWVKVPATDPDHFCLVPVTHMVKERTNFCKLSPDLHKHASESYHPKNTCDSFFNLEANSTLS